MDMENIELTCFSGIIRELIESEAIVMDMNNEPIETAEVPATAEMPETPSITVEPLSEEFVDFDTFSKSDFRVVKVKECIAVPKSKKL